MLDVTDIVNDPDFATTFELHRVSGAFAEDGVWVATEVLPAPLVTGIILPANWDRLDWVPEGERQVGTIVIYCSQELIEGDQQTTQSDIIKWKGEWYKIGNLKQYEQASVWFALGRRFRRVA